MTTVTIKVKDLGKGQLWNIFWIDILADGKCIGEATLYKYYDKNYFGDIIEEYVRLDRIDIDDEHQRRCYGTAAIKALAKKFGRIVAVPDYGDDRGLNEWIGEDPLEILEARDAEQGMRYLDNGYSVYMFN